jgi:hypothetical protein
VDSKDLNKLGPLLFGDRWAPQLARRIDVDEKTVRRWSQGLFSVPTDKASLINQIREARIQALINFK